MKKSATLIALIALLTGYSAYASPFGSDTVQSAQAQPRIEKADAAAQAQLDSLVAQVSKDLSGSEAELYQEIEAYYAEAFDIDALVSGMADIEAEESFVVYDKEGTIVNRGKGEYKNGSFLMKDGSTSYYIID